MLYSTYKPPDAEKRTLLRAAHTRVSAGGGGWLDKGYQLLNLPYTVLTCARGIRPRTRYSLARSILPPLAVV